MIVGFPVPTSSPSSSCQYVCQPWITDSYQHDAVLDYYGRRLATCSSDKTIKIFEIEGETHRLTETLKGYATKPQISANQPH